MPPVQTYYHSGNLGDISYALLAIKLAGGGKLLIGPEQLNSSFCDNPINRTQFERFKPLLDLQPYLTESQFAPNHPRHSSVRDLNQFRNYWMNPEVRNRTKIGTLVKMHCYVLGVAGEMQDSESWLTVNDPIKLPYFACHRSARYRNPNFPWPLIYARLRDRLIFSGHTEEHIDFESNVGPVPFWKPSNFLELARLIKGSLGFIGNQSFPCSLALGLGQKVCQESWPASPDCVFERDNFLTQPFAAERFEAWCNL